VLARARARGNQEALQIVGSLEARPFLRHGKANGDDRMRKESQILYTAIAALDVARRDAIRYPFGILLVALIESPGYTWTNR